ncbi:DUF1707 SHOCT-like domain-containing protein [Pseudonocardia sp. TRM90224]|uniref:DUF1707 SHOCT-like domain-containing protein n=1 Tax=Pseudonocardia sp. TRM90224 TaxID=2812678 RepID=UPI001E610131|nr:DUF1707 domain-containing protein [Pseudonocardia sp. TRM90224]
MDDVGDGDRTPVRPEDMRAGDADREKVLDRLRIAHVEGRLDVLEFDERVAAALAARTYGELEKLTVDLPEPKKSKSVEPRTAAAAPTKGDDDFRQAVTAWAGVSAVTFTIWLITVLVNGLIYPWFLWVAGPWGMIILVVWISRRLRRG